MANSGIKKYRALLFLAVFLCAGVFTADASDAKADTGKEKTVRVGYLLYDGYQEGEGDEPKSGYGYEYLQQIAYYANWKYEYVNGSFNELLEKLKRGEIDIMGNISYTEERAEEIAYASEEQGREYYYLLVRDDRGDIRAEDPATLDGARVGINKGSVQVDLFQDWCEANGIHCDIVLYENSQERYSDMNNGSLDATVSTNVAERDVTKYRWNAILKVGASPYYFAVSKKDPELLPQLNAAIAKVLQSDWYYNEKVYLKYYGKKSASSAGLSREDREWLETKETIRIGYVDNMMPYADFDEKHQEMRGLLLSFLEHMEEQYGVFMETSVYTSYEKLQEALTDGEIDAMFPVYSSFWSAEEHGLMVTEPLSTGYLMIAYRGAYREDISSVIAVTDASSTQQFYVKEKYPEAEMLFCDSMQACIRAVVSGEATATLMSSELYYAYRNEFEDLEELTLSNTGYEIPIGFAVKKGDISMYSFMKKGIASITETKINEAMLAGGYVNPELNLKQFVKRHVTLVLAVAGFVLFLMNVLFIYYIFSTRRAQQLSKCNTELSEKAYVDLATGLPNKNKCKELLSSPLALRKKTAFFMLDLNDLKIVNDTLGHEMGDLMLLNFAKLLRQSVPFRHFVGRFGGDEFIVIAEEIAGKKEAEEIEKKIHEIVLKFNGAGGEVNLSYACGYAYSGDYPSCTMMDLLHEADQRMYEEKQKMKQKTERGMRRDAGRNP